MKFALTLTAALLAQLFFYRYLSFRGVSVNILIILTIQVALVKGRGRGAVFGFFSALAEDLFLSGLIGERIISRVITGWYAGKLKGKVSPGNFLFQFLFVFAAYLFQALLIFLIRMAMGFPQISLRQAVPTAAAGGLIAPLVYIIIKHTDAG